MVIRDMFLILTLSNLVQGVLLAVLALAVAVLFNQHISSSNLSLAIPRGAESVSSP